MSFRKFIVPHLVILFLLSGVWLAGIDQVYVDNDHQTNLTKYYQTLRRISDNYVNETDLRELYKDSIRGLVLGLQDSTIQLENTPLDTAFTNVDINRLNDSYEKFEEAYLYIANNFENEDMTNLTEEAIRHLFIKLDPHSVYIEPEESERIQEDFEGKFEGIGIQFDIIQDTITVVTAISGGPSDQLGIMSGDRIISIGDSSAVGFTIDDVVNTLRGPKGTQVKVTIVRPRTPNPLSFNIIRDEIPLTTLDTSYMLDESTGYLKVNRFAATTHQEFMDAARNLEEQGMERLVLDLRNNPGGYLSQAIAIAEEFFPRGTKLVSTESRHERFEQVHYSRKNGALMEMPIILLVNEGSASASEIVSGAIQDHDRGLIVGRRTFGKGLVQQQYELVDNSNIRVTISKYLTPSGRLIQKPYTNGREEYAYEIYRRSEAAEDASEFLNHVPDSLQYSTESGRPVYGGGGIVPDHIVHEDTTLSGHVFNFMLANRTDFNFVREYLDLQGSQFRNQWGDNFQQFRTDFEFSGEEIERFIEMMEENGLVINDVIEDTGIERRNMEGDLIGLEPIFDNETLTVTSQHLNDVLWMSKGRLKAELAKQVWGMEYFYPVINDVFNDILIEAMKLWDEVDALAARS